jgi:hypothetical protein
MFDGQWFTRFVSTYIIRCSILEALCRGHEAHSGQASFLVHKSQTRSGKNECVFCGVENHQRHVVRNAADTQPDPAHPARAEQKFDFFDPEDVVPISSGCMEVDILRNGLTHFRKLLTEHEDLRARVEKLNLSFVSMVMSKIKIWYA